MTPREKVLSIGVGIAVAVAAGNFLFSSVKKGFKDKNTRIDALLTEITKRDEAITDGLLDRNKLSVLAERSLPTKSEQAAADYREWLIELADLSGLTAKQSFIGETTEKGVYRRFKFQVSGRGTVENLTRLLFAFYEKNYLHRIAQLKVALVPREPYQLDITLVSEVLSLDVASPTQPAPQTKSHRPSKSLEEYEKAIVGRNLFSPANHPPVLAKTATTVATQGSQLAFSPGATDPDKGQEVRYEIEGEAPKGMRVDRDGTLKWTPDAVGEFKVSLRATDSGLPKQSVIQQLTINVEAPKPVETPKAEPKMDVATQAFVSALVTGKNGPEAWVRSRTEGKTIFLKVGDKLTLGSVQGTVVGVGANYIELDTDGKKWTVGLDESLADAYKRLDVD